MRRAWLALLLLAAGCASGGGATRLERAETLWRAGDSAAAAALWAEIVADQGAAGRDEALFRLALAELAAAPRDTVSPRGVERLRRLLAEYPESPYAAPARGLLELVSEMGRLRDQLERLKRIDLGRDGG